MTKSLSMFTLVGTYVPLVLIGCTLFFLVVWYRFISSTVTFLTFWILTNVMVLGLKSVLKEPRPSQSTVYVVSACQYGMPSGHAANCLFCTTFIQLAWNQPTWTLAYFGLSLLSMIQRYVDREHSMLQLVVGAGIGMVMGWCAVRRIKFTLQPEVEVA